MFYNSILINHGLNFSKYNFHSYYSILLPQMKLAKKIRWLSDS